MRRLENCPVCDPAKEHRNIFDCDLVARVKVCRCCGHAKPMRAANKSAVAREQERAAFFEQMLADLLASA